MFASCIVVTIRVLAMKQIALLLACTTYDTDCSYVETITANGKQNGSKFVCFSEIVS